MGKFKLATNVLAALAVGSMFLAPAMSMADGDKGQKGKSKGNHGRSNNGKAPKKEGRHDNRNQPWKNSNQRRGDDDDRRRSNSDDWRREQERRAREAEWNRRNSGSNSSLDREIDRRQEKKNEWRNIAYVAGAAAIYGLLKNDKTLFFAGTAGALYSLHRYEQDRKSQSQLQRLRAEYFSRPYFVRDGQRYNRRVMVKNGQKHYQFVRS